jgi:hypothetical protein
MEPVLNDLFCHCRGLSLFHFWLPLFLLRLMKRLGYDRRAFVAWTAIAWALILVCCFPMPVPPAPHDNPNLPVNINYVYGLSVSQPNSARRTLPCANVVATFCQ